MIEEIILKTRSQQKTGISSDWEKAVNFIPLKGEIIVYSDLNKIKIGDGKTNVNDLAFIKVSDFIFENEEDGVFRIGASVIELNGDRIKLQPGDTREVKIDGKLVATEIEGYATTEYVDKETAKKSQVQKIDGDKTEFIPTLTIHKLTQEEYEQMLEDGNVNEDTLYLTPDEEIDLSGYATEEYVDNAIATIPIPDVSGQIADAIEGIVHPVISVNEKTGSVVLTAEDVGALPADTVIPSVVGLATETYVNNAVAQKSQVQIITWEDDD